MRDNESPLETAINIVRQKAYPPSSRLNAILYMVEKYQPDECLKVFEEVLSDPDEHPDVRSGAALALGKVGGDRALDLLKKMAHEQDNTVRSYSVQGLGMLGREEVIPDLLNALKDEDNHVFASAAEALGRIGKPVVPHLISLLENSPREDARCIAAWQLGTLQETDAVPFLVRVIREDKNTELVALSIWALGEIGFRADDVLDTLNWARGQEDPAINKRADMAMKKIARHNN